MTVTHTLEYPLDIINRADTEAFTSVKKSFESEDWKAITWGADSHDALEFTICKSDEDNDTYVSLYLAIAGERAIHYALQVFVERDGHGDKTTVGNGTLSSFSAEDLEELLKRGIERVHQPDRLTPLVAAVGAADLALERINEMVTALWARGAEARTEGELRLGEGRAWLGRLPGDLMSLPLTPDEIRGVAETYAKSAEAMYAAMVHRGESAVERLRRRLEYEDSPEVSDAELHSSSDQSDGTRQKPTPDAKQELRKPSTRKYPNAHAKKIAAKRTAAKKGAVRKAAAKKRQR